MDHDTLERWRQGQGETSGAGGASWWRAAHLRTGWSAVVGGVAVAGLVGLGTVGGARLLQPAGDPPLVSTAPSTEDLAAPTSSSGAAGGPPSPAPAPASLEPEPVGMEPAGMEPAAADAVAPAPDLRPSRPDCAAVTAPLSADVDGDGCAEELRYADGILSATDGVRWEVGQEGDRVATGDWWCEGDRTLALLRPSSGQAFVFPGWAGPGADLEAMSVGRAEAASALRAADLDGDGCGELVVERGALTPAVLPIPDRRGR